MTEEITTPLDDGHDNGALPPLSAAQPDLGVAGTLSDLQGVSEAHRRTARAHAEALEATLAAYREGCAAAQRNPELSRQGRASALARLKEATMRQLGKVGAAPHNGSSIDTLSAELREAETAALPINRFRALALRTSVTFDKASIERSKQDVRSILLQSTPDERWAIMNDAVSLGDHVALLAVEESLPTIRHRLLRDDVGGERWAELAKRHLHQHCPELADRLRELKLLIGHISWNQQRAQNALR